jgi:hypothetical protein
VHLARRQRSARAVRCRGPSQRGGRAERVAGLEEGLVEILQGSAAPSDPAVDAIGPLRRLWGHGTEPALTLIPNLLVTGIVATLVSLLVVVWAASLRIEKRFEACEHAGRHSERILESARRRYAALQPEA